MIEAYVDRTGKVLCTGPTPDKNPTEPIAPSGAGHRVGYLGASPGNPETKVRTYGIDEKELHVLVQGKPGEPPIDLHRTIEGKIRRGELRPVE